MRHQTLEDAMREAAWNDDNADAVQGVYTNAHREYSNVFLPLIVADGLARELPDITLGSGRFEKDFDGNICLHYPEVKLAWYPNYQERGPRAAAIVCTMGDDVGKVFTSIWFMIDLNHPDPHLIVNFVSQDQYGRQVDFTHRLSKKIDQPRHWDHPLINQLRQVALKLPKLHARGIGSMVQVRISH